MTRTRKITLTFTTALLMAVAVLAVPALAQPGGPGSGGPPDDPGAQAGHKDDDGGNETDGGGPDRGGRERGAQHRQDAWERASAALDSAYDRCIEATNGSDRCDKIKDAKSHALQARRAASACINAQDAWEHRITLLELREKRIRDSMDENATANETAEAEAKLERIQTLQDKFLVKIERCQDRVDGLEERHEAVRAFAYGREKVEVCHFDEETNSTVTLRIARPALDAHLRHGDAEGPCAEESLAVSDDDSSDGSDDGTDGSDDGQDDAGDEDTGGDDGDSGSDDGDGDDGSDDGSGGNETADGGA